MATLLSSALRKMGTSISRASFWKAGRLVNSGGQEDATFTALKCAADRGHVEIVQLLLGNGASVNQTIQKGATALMFAVEKNQVDVARVLVENGAAIDQATNAGDTAFSIAACEGHTDAVRLLLEKGADIEKTYANGHRALTSAAQYGRIDVVEALLQGGAHIDAVSDDGSSALLIAAMFGQLDAVRALVKCGASVDLADTYGNSPLMVAAENKHADVVKLLLEAGASVTAETVQGDKPLPFAVSGGDVECVRLMLEHGADVNETGANRCSVLQMSVVHGHMEVFKLLLSRSAEINTHDNDDNSVLHEATLHGQLEAVRLLLDLEADVNVANGVGWTPLVITSQRGHVDIATLLLENGADVDAKTSDGRTALVHAADEGQLEIIRLLLGHDADVNVQDSEGQTALMRAVYRGNEDIVHLLLDSGAAIDVTDSSGRTAVEVARLNCRYQIRAILEDYRAEHPTSTDGKQVATEFKRALPDWLIPSREVRKDQQPFSAGSFGQVYRGWWLSTRVVVKTVTVVNEKESRTFHREARIWQKARHPNIVPFFGACDEGSTYFFVCEEAKNGKLLDYLYHAREEEGRSLVWRKLLDAALGLHFLHERHIVHSDLKCNQILVSKDGVAMLTDFGLSFLSTEQSGDEETVGAIRWKAPEVIRKDKPVAPNAQSDVYAFGMCVVEAVTCDVPWGQRVPDPVVKFHVTRQKFMPRPKAFDSDAQWELVLRLCAFEPSERMKLADAIEVIRGFAEEERFQERLQEMKEEIADDVSDIGVGVKEPAKLPKMRMGSVQALTKVRAIGHSIRAKRGGVSRQVAAA